MTDLATGFRWGHFVLMSLAVGVLFVNRLAEVDRQSLGVAYTDRVWVSGFLVLAIGCLIGLVAAEAMDAVGSESLSLGRFGQFWVSTWVGNVAIARTVLILIAIAACWTRLSIYQSNVVLACALAALAILPAGGHAISADPSSLALVAQAGHTVATALWFGALLVIAAKAFCGRFTLRGANQTRALLARFSTFALPLMAVAIVTGLTTAVLQMGRPAALFGTAYGATLLVKVLLLVPVLALAARLRFVYLKSQEAGENPWRPLLAEAALAVVLVFAAASLAQTIPARHDDIVWPLRFRFAPEIAWKGIGVPETVSISFWAALIALLITGMLWRRYGRERARTTALLAIVGLAALVIAAANLTVEAYPTTYAKSGSPFGAQAVAAGRATFEKTCVGCHGEGGHGDGPLMPPGAILPNTLGMADLTAAHTNDHTIGDMFWWIGEGKPNTAMPGFKSALSALERWQLIDYLRVLSLGYQARLIDQHVAANQPWLPSIDFSFQTDSGDLGSLKGFRDRSAVLLAILQDPAELDRIKYLKENADGLADRGLEIVVVAAPAAASALRRLAEDGAARPAIVTRNADEAVLAWSNYRRTLKTPDTDNTAEAVSLIEFLIDRYGYVRARWVSGEESFAKVSALADMARQLASEPQLLPPPDEHAH